MLIKAGVTIATLSRPARRALLVCSFLVNKIGLEIVITSTNEGNHSAGSLHYANDAFDFRSSCAFGPDFIVNLKFALGYDYDVVAKKDHVHVEYDPKK